MDFSSPLHLLASLWNAFRVRISCFLTSIQKSVRSRRPAMSKIRRTESFWLLLRKASISNRSMYDFRLSPGCCLIVTSTMVGHLYFMAPRNCMRKTSFSCFYDEIDHVANFVNQTFAFSVKVMEKYLQVARLETWLRAMNDTKSRICALRSVVPSYLRVKFPR